MFTRSRVALAVIVLSVALLAYVIFGSSDEDKVVLRVKELASAVETRADESLLFRTARINKVFKESLEPDVTFRAPELPSKSGIRELGLLAAEAGQTFGSVRLSVGATDVHVDHELARAVSEITLTSERGNELHGDRRSVRFELRREGGDFRVSSIDVAPKSGEQPEARP
ncbi:MAG TPA: hypothetical protein VGQ57_13800 [Polyangiaceae bacterium]|jgi:hypothetical protein|nr:hypothetical protein [Polyangiaceae bacterium]